MKYTEDNIGDIIEYSDERGSYYEERVVLVYCQICGARYIGPIREAGGECSVSTCHIHDARGFERASLQHLR